MIRTWLLLMTTVCPVFQSLLDTHLGKLQVELFKAIKKVSTTSLIIQ